MGSSGDTRRRLSDDERAIWLLEQLQTMVRKSDAWRGYVGWESDDPDYDFSDGMAWAALQRAVDALRNDPLRAPVTDARDFASWAEDQYNEWRKAETDKRRWDSARTALSEKGGGGDGQR